MERKSRGGDLERRGIGLLGEEVRGRGGDGEAEGVGKDGRRRGKLRGGEERRRRGEE